MDERLIHQDIAVIGRGLAGLSLAFELGRRGFRKVSVFGSPSVPGSASQAAVGVVTLKGWNEPRAPLFVAKYAGHKTLEVWIQSVEKASGCKVRRFWHHVYEPFSDREQYGWIRERVYHREFCGTLAMSIKQNHTFSHHARWLGAYHYWQDGWVHPGDLLVAMEAAAKSYGIVFIEENVEAITPGAKSKMTLMGHGAPLGDFDQAILAAGIFSHQITSNLKEVALDLKPVSGCTLVGNDDCSKETQAVIEGKMALAINEGQFRYGSTSVLEAIEQPKMEYDGINIEKHEGILKDKLAVFGGDLKPNKTLYGVRARTKDRLPISGSFPVSHTHRLWVLTGLYKNGLQLAHLFAQNLVDQLVTDQCSPVFLPFSPARFFSTGI